MTTVAAVQTRSFGRNVPKGILAGIVGGIVFGIMMAMMGSLTMIAKMMGSDSAVVGFAIHLMISSVFGAGYGLIARRASGSVKSSLGLGMAYGLFLWVVGALVMMPIMMGMSGMIFHVEGIQLMSLMGHIIFGVVTALVFYKLKK